MEVSGTVFSQRGNSVMLISVINTWIVPQLLPLAVCRKNTVCDIENHTELPREGAMTIRCMFAFWLRGMVDNNLNTTPNFSNSWPHFGLERYYTRVTLRGSAGGENRSSASWWRGYNRRMFRDKR